MSLEELEEVKDTCVCIAKKKCDDRVQQWITSHVNSSIFNKDFQSEVDKLLSPQEIESNKATFVLPPCGKDVKHNPLALSGAKLIENMLKLSVDILEHRAVVDSNDVEKLLNSMCASIEQRRDVNDIILKAINQLLVDLILLIITHCTDICSDIILQNFIKCWRQFNKWGEDLFTRILCPRNVMLIAQSCDVRKSWLKLGEFVTLLIQNQLLTCEAMESQCLALYQKEWDQVSLVFGSK